MTKFKKILIRLTACLAALLILLTALTLIANRLIKQERFLSKIQAGASQALGGRVNLQRFELALFPRPNIVLHRASFSIPDTAEGTIASVALYPRMLSVLRGRFLCSRIDLKAPDIKIRLLKKQAPEERRLTALSIESFVKVSIGAILNRGSFKSPGLDVLVKNGRLDVTQADRTGYKVKNIHARVDLRPDNISLNIRCEPVRWESLILKGSLHLSKNRLSPTHAKLDLRSSGFNLSAKVDINHPPQPSVPSLSLEVKSKALDVLAARKAALTLAGDIPVVQDIFKIVKAGRLPHIAVTSHGNSLEDLGRLNNINIRGRMLNGEIFVPDINLDLTQVTGDAVISQGILYVNNSEARLGNSQGRQGALTLGLEGQDAPFHLDVTIDADLAQLPAVLTSLVDNDAFVKELAQVKDLTGNATGRLVMGERLSSIETQVEVTQFNLSANYRRLPYRLNMHGERFTYQNARVTFKNTGGNMGKSSFSKVSLALDFKDSPFLDIKAGPSSLLMDEIYPWLVSYDAIKDKLQNLKPVKGVLTLATLHLQGPPLLPQKWHLQMIGNLALQQRLNIFADIALTPDTTTVNKLTVNDDRSNAALTLTLADNAVNLSFRGILSNATLNHLMYHNRLLKGWVNGDFHGSLLLDQPFKPSVQGNLKVRELVVPLKKNVPLTVNRLDIEAKENKLLIESADLSLANSRFDIKGNANFLADGLNFDMSLTADNLDIDNLKKVWGQKKKLHEQAEHPNKTYPIQGHLKLNAATMTYAGFTWNPFYGDAIINNDIATVSVIDANLCGVATPGQLKISPQKISLNLKPTAKNQRLHSAIDCLLNKTVKVEGNFNFNGNITAQDAGQNLLEAVNGDFDFTAGKGRLYSGQFHGILVQLVRLLSVTEIFRGKLPDIGRKGFGYNSIKAKADVKNGIIHFNEMVIDGLSMNITVRGNYDLTHNFIHCVAWVSPLKTFDAVIKNIPVIKDVLGGSLYTIAYSIKDHPDNPKFKRLSASEVDSELIEIMQRTIRLPAKIIQPNLYKGQKK